MILQRFGANENGTLMMGKSTSLFPMLVIIDYLQVTRKTKRIMMKTMAKYG